MVFVASNKRPRTKRPNKKRKTRQALKFSEIAVLPIEDTTTIRRIAQRWVNFYKKDTHRVAAQTEFINLTLEACGIVYANITERKDLAAWYPVTKTTLPSYHIEDSRFDINKLKETSKPGDYSTLRDYKSLQEEFPHIEHNLKLFCHFLMMQTQKEEDCFFSILKDLMDWVIPLACDLPIGFDCSVSWMALQAITSLVEFAKTQYDLGMKSVQQMRDVELKIIEYFQGFFPRVYKKRNQDIINQDIRRSCLEELKWWTTTYPSIFSKPPYQEFLKDQI